jgi:Uncharacterized conserved protein
MDWLLKTEPSTYSFEDLVREKTTTWDGVTNAQARLHLRSMKKGDRLVVYHTGDVKAAVGRATVGAAPRPDPADPKGTVVDVKAGRALKKARDARGDEGGEGLRRLAAPDDRTALRRPADGRAVRVRRRGVRSA